MHGFTMACIELCVVGQTLYRTEKQGFAYPWLSQKFQTHPPKFAKAEPSFRRSAYPL